MQACSALGIKQIFTSWSNPKGNADTERVIRTIKEDLVWPYDWDNPFDFQRALDKWVDNYNPSHILQFCISSLIFKKRFSCNHYFVGKYFYYFSKRTGILLIYNSFVSFAFNTFPIVLFFLFYLYSKFN